MSTIHNSQKLFYSKASLDGENENLHSLGSDEHRVSPLITENQKSKFPKKWSVAAIIVGSLSAVLITSIGVLFLLNSQGLIPFSHSFQWISVAMQTVSTPYAWNIIVLSAVGVLVSGGAVILGCGLLARKQQKSPPDEKDSLFKEHIDGLGGSQRRKPVIQSEDEFSSSATEEEEHDPFSVTHDKFPFNEEVRKQELFHLNGEYFRFNISQLATAPSQISLKQDLENDLEILKIWSRQAFNDQEKEMVFAAFVNLIKKESGPIYQEMVLYLKNIIEILKLQPEKRQNFLENILESVHQCLPTKFETIRRAYCEWVNIPDGKQQMLYWILEIKEEIILKKVQELDPTQWHGVSYIRMSELGRLVGLNFIEGQKDNYLLYFEEKYRLAGFVSKVGTYFCQHFTLERLVSALEIKVNERASSTLFAMLKAFVMKSQNKTAEEALLFIQQNFYDECAENMTREGILALLESIDYIERVEIEFEEESFGS